MAAFLVNVVLVPTGRPPPPEIAALKALGYSNREIGGHFFGLVVVTVALGILMGTAGGASFGRWMTDLYAGFFRFPVLRYQLSWQVLGLAAGVSAAAAGLRAWIAIGAAVRLPPAEAMRPPAPARYHLRGFERGRLARFLGTVPMMIVRETLRRPLRSLASALGVGAAVGVMIIGRVNFDRWNTSSRI